MTTRPRATAVDASAAAILAIVARIPRGQVTTYGVVAARAGWPRRARLVGRVLARLPAGSRAPWHRVVAAGGRIALPPGSKSHREQVARLRREGVPVARGRVNLEAHGWGSATQGIDQWLWMVGADHGRRGAGGQRSAVARRRKAYDSHIDPDA